MVVSRAWVVQLPREVQLVVVAERKRPAAQRSEMVVSAAACDKGFMVLILEV